ncbi:MAG: UDP-3-O-(3-hydroxymyristoyl)glucosamine N-acyltransferase [Lachnospiraceae bacterium]|nr:UDP-3-O-(3-hydroxymyristoyl)glucosamine N-acyltransferase [Lachnospiraceae bacterium]
MKLSEMVLYENEELLSDGEFERLDLLKSKSDKKLFSFLDSEQFLEEARNKNVACIVCRKELVPLLPKDITGIMISKEPYISFWRRHNEMQKPREKFISRVGKGCNISPMAYIAKSNVVIGDNVVIEEFVSIKENVVIGNNCIIRAGSVIGGQGYEFKNTNEGPLFPVEHFGGVIIGNDVEIQQMTNVAKAIYPDDDTIIGNGTKIDALVHIAHADKIGYNCHIIAGVVIGGSTCVGDNVWIGPNATLRNGICIGDKARISLGSVVTKDVEAGKTVSGYFAIDHNIFLDNFKANLKNGKSESRRKK